MSKGTSFVFICLLYVIWVPNTHGVSNGKVNLQKKTIVTAFTPFDSDENLDVSLIPQIAEYYKTNNIAVVYVAAYYGGGPTLNLKEKKALVSAWEEQANSLGFDLIVEIEPAPFVEVLEFAQFCSEKNVTALTAFAEVVYQPAVPSEMVEDLQRICDAANGLPLYHHELIIVGQEVGPVQTYLSACNKVSCFAGIIASIDSITLTRASAPNALDCEFWVDTTDQTAGGLLLRANAATSPAVNLCPGVALDIEKAADANDIKQALKLQQRIDTVIAALGNMGGGIFDYTSSVAFQNMKAVFSYKTGINVGARYPQQLPNSTVAEKLKSIAANLDCY